jgi:hypothetical protein
MCLCFKDLLPWCPATVAHACVACQMVQFNSSACRARFSIVPQQHACSQAVSQDPSFLVTKVSYAVVLFSSQLCCVCLSVQIYTVIVRYTAPRCLCVCVWIFLVALVLLAPGSSNVSLMSAVHMHVSGAWRLWVGPSV